MSTMGGAETFQLTIRCAMQSFPDHTLECPANWSVFQLKKHLAQECVTKPDPSRQRLIYAGRCLDNDQKVRDVLAQRRDGIVRNEMTEKQVIHMVYIGVKNSESSGTTTAQGNNPTVVSASSEGVRHRGNNGQQNASPSLNSTTHIPPQQQQQSSAFVPPLQQHYFATAFPPQQQQQSYDVWMAAYQNYMTQMAQFYQQMPYASIAQMGVQQPYSHLGGSSVAQQQIVHAPLPMMHHLHPVQQAQMVPQQRAAGDAPMQQQQQRMREAEALGGGAQADLLDIVYKSIRFALLAIVLYVYSSLERFFLVLAVVAFFWFVHRRRNQQQRENIAPEPINVPPPPQQRPNAAAGEDHDNNMVANGQPEAEGATVEAVQQQQTTSNDNVPQQPSALNVFFTVVQSFFTSLVPNPMPAPMDIN